MNRVYSLVWNAVQNTWVVAHEWARRRGKRNVRAASIALLLTLPAIGHADGRTALAGLAPPAPAALPTGGVVTAGGGNIRQSGTSMTVTQNTSRMVVDWNSFDIGAQASVTIRQPGSDSVALNRVLSSDPTQIYGHLSANGQVFLLDSAGILFGKGAQVNTGGLVASTLNIGDSDFLAGNYRFGSSAPTGTVVNQGQLKGRTVVLIAPQVSNEGAIDAAGGSAVLAAGGEVSLDLTGDGLVTARVERGATNAWVRNQGTIAADGGMAQMTARSSGDTLSAVVNNDGLVQARGLSNRNGHIILDGGDDGVTRAAGTLDASSAEGIGGRIVVSGDKVLIDEGARLDATGRTGGGEVLVGGGWQGVDPSIRQATSTVVAPSAVLDASATGAGDGGTVVAWSDVHNPDSATRAWGTFLADGGPDGGNGGRIETSGHWLDTQGARGSAVAPAGGSGSWLFDPYDVTIDTSSSSNGSFVAGTWTPSGSGSTILNTDIDALLNAGTSVTITTSGAGAESGDITVNAPITKSSGGTDVVLSLKADQSILLNSSIASTGGAGKLDVTLDSNANDGGAGGILMVSGTSIVTNGGDITLSGGSVTTTGFALGTPNTGDRGIWTQQDTTLDASGTVSGGNIVLRGNGTTTGEGMLIGWGGSGPSSTIKTNGTGTITMTGSGGGQVVGRFVTGVSLWNTAVQTDSGAINITGTGGVGNGADDNSGVMLNTNGFTTDNRIVSASGPISITGVRGTGTTSIGAGIWLSSGSHAIGQDGSLVTSSTSDITLETDSLEMDSGTLQSSGALTIQPHTTSATIGIGDGASGTLNLDAGEIGKLHDGFSSITIGRADGTGAIEVQSAAFTDDVVIRTPSGAGDLTVTGALSTGAAASAGSITLRAGNNVALAASSSITTQGQAVTLDADSDDSTAGTVTLDSGSSIATHGGDILLSGGSDPTSGYAAGAKAVWLNGTDIDSGGGDIVLRGKGRGANSSADTPGIKAESSTVDSGTGAITLLGDSFDGSAGIFLAAGASFTSAKTNGTAISVTGNAGQTLASDDSPGLLMIDGSLTATGTGGNIVLNGLGGMSNTSGNTFNAKGIAIAGGAGATIQAEGTLTMTGTARDDVGNNSVGVSIENYSGNLGAQGGITITGNSQKAGISDVELRQDSGAGTLGNATTSSITLIGDRIALAVGAGTTAVRTSANGTVSVLPRTAGRAVSLGSADGTTALDIDNTELNRITTGTLYLGRDYADSTAAGPLTVDGALTFDAVKLPSIVLRGTDVTFNQSLTKDAAGDAALSARASGDVTLNASGDLNAALPGKLGVTLDADADGDGVGALLMASGASITTNGGAFTASFGTMTASDAISGSISTGAGNLLLTGTHPSQLRLAGASLSTTAGNLDIAVGTGAATGSKIELGGGTSLTTQHGAITLTQTDTDGSIVVGADASGASIDATGTGSVTLDNSADTYLHNDASITAAGGLVTLTAAANHFADVGNFTLTNASGDVAIDGQLMEGTGGTLTARGLELDGAGAFDLSAGSNTIGTLAANGITSLNLKDTGSLTVGTVQAVDGVTAGGDVTLEANGAAADLTLDKPVTTTGGDIVAVAGRNFINDNATDTGLVASGRYLIYSSDPAASTEGMSTYDKHYDQGYAAGATPSYAASGNWFLYSIAPVLSVVPDTRAITYGDATPGFVPASYTGFIDGDDAGSAGIGGSAAFSVGGAVSGSGQYRAGNHDVTYTSGLSSSLGYQFQDDSASVGELSVGARTLSLSGFSALDKVYDGTTSATIDSAGSLTGVVSGDAVSASNAGATFNDKNAGPGKLVTLNGVTLSGVDSGDYRIAGSATTTASITAKPLTAAYHASNKEYDGTTAATVTGSSPDVVHGDVVNFNQDAVFTDKNVGTGKTINVSHVTLSGTDAANYSLRSTTATAVADITPKPLTVDYTGRDKVYDGNTAATVVGASDDIVPGDMVSFSQDAEFRDKDVGTGKTIDIRNIALNGADAENYRLQNDTATATADITPKPSLGPAITAALQTDREAEHDTGTPIEVPSAPLADPVSIPASPIQVDPSAEAGDNADTGIDRANVPCHVQRFVDRGACEPTVERRGYPANPGSRASLPAPSRSAARPPSGSPPAKPSGHSAAGASPTRRRPDPAPSR